MSSIEVAQHQLPIIARDLHVLKEVVGEHGYYFSGLDANDLAMAIKEWIVLYRQNGYSQINGPLASLYKVDVFRLSYSAGFNQILFECLRTRL